MGTEPGVGVPDSATFAQALGKLKREGSNILLVGDAAVSSHESACRRLLGDASADSRYRLIVVTGRSGCTTATPAVDTDDEKTRYVVRAPSGDDAVEWGYPEAAATETSLLGALGSDVVAAIDDFESHASGLEPSELRVCVDSIGDILDEHASENIFRLLHVMTTRIRQVSGMGHFHLPVDRDHEAVHLFEPLFDAVVEIRSTDGDPEHRWHLRDTRTSSDWLEL